jgi:hypothetical protein
MPGMDTGLSSANGAINRHKATVAPEAAIGAGTGNHNPSKSPMSLLRRPRTWCLPPIPVALANIRAARCNRRPRCGVVPRSSRHRRGVYAGRLHATAVLGECGVSLQRTGVAVGMAAVKGSSARRASSTYAEAILTSTARAWWSVANAADVTASAASARQCRTRSCRSIGMWKTLSPSRKRPI